MPVAAEMLSERECYLLSIIQDHSGIDLAEFTWVDNENKFGIWRAWPFQWKWYKDDSTHQIEQSGRSLGKSLSIKMRMFAFPFLHPGAEAVVTAPELVHLLPIIGLIENQFLSTRIGREMLPKGKNNGITHRPFEMDFLNGSRILGRIPQKDGKGIKGCVGAGVLVLTKRGLIPVESVTVGDFVWSHLNRWSEVRTVQSFEDDVVELGGQGSFPTVVSADHKLLVRRDVSKQPGKTTLRLGDFLWKRIPELESSKYCTVPWYWTGTRELADASMQSVLPDYSKYNQNVKPHTSSGYDFWWCVGRYIADGSVENATNDSGAFVRGRVNFCVHPKDQPKVIRHLEAIGFTPTAINRSHSSADMLQICSTPVAEWLADQFGRTAYTKKIPVWLLFADATIKRALLDGYQSGDGHDNKSRRRNQSGSASKALSLALGLMGQTLGHAVGYGWTDPKQTEIMGIPLKKKAARSWQVRIGDSLTRRHEHGPYVSYKIKSIKSLSEKRKVYNIISDDHSYLGDGIFHHNTHPLWLEMDEAQDYPEPGWAEIIETLKQGSPGAVWRCHGVTKGVQDSFYKTTQPDSGFQVHRYCAMWRPTWSAEEREQKIKMYGSRNAPDYRRNVLGLHGDASQPIFVLSRLMQNVCQDQSDPYNTDLYQNIRITHEMIEDSQAHVTQFLDFPGSHKQYKTVWAGMDVGYTQHPSEILVFAEEHIKGKDSVFRLLTRIHMERVSHQDQVAAILHVVSWYKVKAFSMDRTGLGLPLFQDIQQHDPKAAHLIKGYNFSEKVAVEIDESIEIDEFKGNIEDALIKRNVLEASTDILRDLVDNKRLILPWDRDLIGEFQGQTYYVKRDNINMYGKRSFSTGSFHALDAARMAILGWSQERMELLTKKPEQQPVAPIFMNF